MSPLNVYKASAGSGKTFALTLGYMVLLFKTPDAFRHILAVTFTNKAAGEMKKRILDRLHRLSRLGKADQSDDLDLLAVATGMDRQSIIDKSGILLKTILNNYSRFSVGTIDKFFQSVIRAFTREIGIQPGYNLELDQLRVLGLGIDMLFQDISRDKELEQWLIRFAEERMADSLSWNFRRDIDQLGMHLFQESFQELFADPGLAVLGKENLEVFRKDLLTMEKRARDEIVRSGNKALEHLAINGLEITNFKGKSNSPPSLFIRAAREGEVSFTRSKLESVEQPVKWLNKDATEEMAVLTERVLMPLLKKIYEQQVLLNSAAMVRKHLYTLGILGDIREKVMEYLKEHNLFLISDSSRFLRGIIGANQVPFVYERTGNRYHHIMLDEFQDTSVFQYENFRPLIDNALAMGKESYVVGDVKQSIYRWRNSDWRILADQLETDFAHQQYRVKPLDRNFRSREIITRFNNTIFQLAPELLAEEVGKEQEAAAINRRKIELAVRQFRSAYSDAVQQIPISSEGSGGVVKINFFPEDGEKTFRQMALERIPEWIGEIQQAGIEPGEIAILVRSRREGIQVAERLLEHARTSPEGSRYRFVSSESLLVSKNEAVSLIIAVLTYLVFPEDQLNNALLKYRCFLNQPDHRTDFDGVFDISCSPETFFPEAFMNVLHRFRQMPIFELVESLISIFGLDRQQEDLPYIQAFQDMVLELQRRESPSIPDFLEFWSQHGHRAGVRVSEHSNAISVLTIHRAKGLEFKAVIVPFCNWEITTDHRKSNILWCNTAGTAFDRIPVVPVKFSGRMAHTCFSGAYYQERMRGYLDNLNLMYVAFTRAADLLYVGAPDTEGEGLKTTGDLLIAVQDLVPRIQPALEAVGQYRAGNTITIGEMPEYTRKKKTADAWQLGRYVVDHERKLPKLRMRSDGYFVDEEGLFRTGRAFGNTMHMVFSRITTFGDIDYVIDRLWKEGILPAASRRALREEIVEKIGQVRDWFVAKEGRTVILERSILCTNGQVLRPDRVLVDRDGVTVVDFKFGMFEKPYYKSQVAQYMEQLRQMGYKNVRGFLWYVMLDKTIQIEEE